MYAKLTHIRRAKKLSKRIIKTLLEIRSKETQLHYFSAVSWKKESPNLFTRQPEYERVKNEEASESDKEEEIMDVPFEESESKEEVSASEPQSEPTERLSEVAKLTEAIDRLNHTLDLRLRVLTRLLNKEGLYELHRIIREEE